MAITTSTWQLNELDTQLIDMAFVEDLGLPHADITTTTVFSDIQNNTAHANIISKQAEPIVICGLPVVKAILAKLSDQFQVQTSYQDGDTLLPDATLLTATGPAHALLNAERIMLNFLQHLSGVATLTRQFVTKIQHTSTRILDTRKTHPGFRHLEKYAVHCGGGVNHRMGLYDAIMIKDTHSDFLGGVEKALAKLPDNITEKCPVIVEVRDQTELTRVLEQKNKVTRVLLDNMTLAMMRECVELCQNIMPTEASGNMNLETVVDVAETGVDFISIGRLTHSAGNVDLSMRCDFNHV